MVETKGVQSRSALYKVQGGRCFYCCTKLSRGRYDSAIRRNGYTSDHFMPKYLGFHSFDNIVLACNDCNNRKGCAMPSSKALNKFELLVLLRLKYPKLTAAEIGKLASWLLPYF